MPIPSSARTNERRRPDPIGDEGMTSTSLGDRVWLTLSAGVALFAIVARVHDVATYPPMYDWDASGHAINVIDLFELRLPNPRSWAGTHPPLFYAIGAAL